MKRSQSALVIGNGAYTGTGALKNPVNDAADIKEKLVSFGFDVVYGENCSALKMEENLKDFKNTLDEYDVALFYFAGHGIQVDGVNYLLAIDTDCSSSIHVKYSSLSLDKVLDCMDNSRALTKIVILDACRNNPWEQAWNRDISARGLASVYAPKGTIIGFATSPGEVASDGGAGRNGAYTAALLQHIGTKDCPVELMFKRVRNTVAAATGGSQTSWEHTSLSGEFFFNLGIDKLIDEYKEEALADGLFALDPSKPSHEIIAGLQTYNWYKQNPALAKLDDTSVRKMGVNNLFVLGRNIYQAACGSSGAADLFINGFMTRTAGFADARRKALLDGMLFEIFFDSTGNLRPAMKKGYFNEVFDLQKHKELKKSFQFIESSLIAAGAEFRVVPGSGREAMVTVQLERTKNGGSVKGIFLEGCDILRLPEDEWDDLEKISPLSKTTVERFNSQLSEKLAVPERLLSVVYSPVSVEEDEVLYIPRGWSVSQA